MDQAQITTNVVGSVRRSAALLCAGAAGIALLTLLGWALRLPLLTDLIPGYPAMNPLTAVCVGLAASALWRVRMPRAGFANDPTATVAGALVVALAGIRLASAISGVELPIDLALFREQIAASSVHSRMGGNTAFGYFCLGLGILSIDRRARSGWRPAEALFLVALAVAVMSIVGYFYSAALIRGIMAINTAFALAALSVGALLARPDRGVCGLLLSESPGGVLARRVIPPAILVPVLLGWLRLEGQRSGYFTLEIGTALLVLIIIGTLVGFVWATGRHLDAQDVERRRVERALAQSLQRQNILLETNLIGILTAKGTLITEANPAFLEMIGRTREELPLESETITPPEWRGRTAEILREIAEHGRSTPWEKEYLRKDGTRVSALIGAARVPGTDDEVMAFVVDLSGKRRAELEIARMSHFLDSIVENLPNMVFVKDADDLRFVRFNRAGEELLGFSREEFIGKSDHDFFPAEQAAAFVAKDRAVLASGTLFDIAEEQIKTRGGEIRILHTKKVPIVDDAGTPRYLLGISEDITERLRAEREVAMLNEGLRQRTEELEAANRELEAFSYSVSHDLRAPLRHISGFADLLVRQAGPALDENGRRYLAHMSDAARSMGQLIDGLLGFSRMSRSQMQERTVALGAMVGEIQAGLARETTDRDIDWEVGALPIVHGDPEMLRLVFTNLLANAVKYTGRRECARIEIGARSGEHEDVVYIRDNGVGFDMEYAHKLFGVFQRLHGDDEFEGTGIGLANVRRVIHRHGGRTWAEGQVGVGATFYVELPRRIAPPALEEAA